MRVLLDENLPLDLALELRGHDVHTVPGLGWAGISNGELMRRAAGRYDAFVTMDRNIEFQQHIPSLACGVILLRAASNRMVHLLPLVPALLNAIESATPGRLQQIGA